MWEKRCLVTKICDVRVEKNQVRGRKKPSGKVEERELITPVIIDEVADTNAKKGTVDDASKYKKKAEEAEAALQQVKNEHDNYIKRATEAEVALADLSASLHSYIGMDHDELKGICTHKGIKNIGRKPTKKHKFFVAIL
jgi:hypothetical protein